MDTNAYPNPSEEINPAGVPNPEPATQEPDNAMVFSTPDTQPARPQSPASAGQPLRQILGKTVISISNGQKLGSVQDILVDPQACKVAALALTRGSLLNREVVSIPVADIQAWGLHAIMVDRPDAAVHRDKLPEQARWVSASDQIQGRPVLTLQGTRIGQVIDLEIDSSGQVVAYNLSTGGDDPQAKGAQRIPARFTRSIGQDVIIVDLGQGEAAQQA